MKEVWSRPSWLDVVCSAIVVMGLLVEILRMSGGVFNFLEYLAVLAPVYILIRFVNWWRSIAARRLLDAHHPLRVTDT